MLRRLLPVEFGNLRSHSVRAPQRINGLAGPAADRAAPSYPKATKLEKKDSSDRFMQVPPRVGGASAFQADDEGSIPFTRSNDFSHLERQMLPTEKWEAHGKRQGGR